MGFPGGAAVKKPPANVGDTGDVGLIPWRTKWQPTPLFLPGKSHGHRSLVGCSPRGRTRLSDWGHTHASSSVFYPVLSLSMLSITNIFPKKHIFLLLWLFLSSPPGLLFPLNFISLYFSSSSSFRIAYVTYYDLWSCHSSSMSSYFPLDVWVVLCVCVWRRDQVQARSLGGHTYVKWLGRAGKGVQLSPQ